jgi:short-subunit dehydrogenase
MKKTALITGASSGIGKQFAILHAQNNGDLIIIARSEKDLKGLKAQLESQYEINVQVIVQDLTEQDAVDQILEQVITSGQQIDYLINNAGFGGSGLFHKREWEKDQSMIQLNVIALTELTRKILPQMVKRNSGKIMNVSSTASLMPGPLQAVYFATKAYVRSFSNALSEELSNTNITVTNLMPGATETGFAKTAGLEDSVLFKDTASAESVAQKGYNAMLKGSMDQKAGVSLGQRIMLNALPLTPKKAVLKMIRKMQE